MHFYDIGRTHIVFYSGTIRVIRFFFKLNFLLRQAECTHMLDFLSNQAILVHLRCFIIGKSFHTLLREVAVIEYLVLFIGAGFTQS